MKNNFEIPLESITLGLFEKQPLFYNVIHQT